jgi:outer membrane murein-binding lipoprotein Lpp
MRKRTKALLIAAVASVVSCSGCFMAGYDPQVDSGATQLQQKVDRFLTDLERTAGTPAGEHKENQAAYRELRSDLAALRDLAGSQRGNGLTVQSLDRIGNNLDKLEEMHAGGISAKEIEIARALFDSQFRMLLQLENAKKRQGGQS